MQSIDVIIPVLNDAEALKQLLADLAKATEACPCEVRSFVVDGGSSDHSAEIAKSADSGLISATGGRGPQLAEGCRAGTGDLVLMLHADTHLHHDALKTLSARLVDTPDVQWGILGHDYDGGGLAARWALITNRLRFHLLGIAFGDQGIFIRRSTLDEIGGIPELPLMEDVELSRRLRGRPRTSLGKQLSLVERAGSPLYQA